MEIPPKLFSLDMAGSGRKKDLTSPLPFCILEAEKPLCRKTLWFFLSAGRPKRPASFFMKYESSLYTDKLPVIPYEFFRPC